MNNATLRTVKQSKDLVDSVLKGVKLNVSSLPNFNMTSSKWDSIFVLIYAITANEALAIMVKEIDDYAELHKCPVRDMCKRKQCAYGNIFTSTEKDTFRSRREARVHRTKLQIKVKARMDAIGILTDKLLQAYRKFDSCEVRQTPRLQVPQ